MNAFESLFDSHAHVISDDTGAYPPAPISGRLREGALDRPMTAERLLDEMDREGVRRAALVQRAHVYGYDNSYVVDAASRHSHRFSAICVIDSTAARAGDRALEWLDRGAQGIRLTEPARGADGAWLRGPAALKVWEAVSRAGGSISIQLYTWNRLERIGEIPALAARFPGTPIIVEHLSNLTETADHPDHGVDAALDALSPFDNVHLKLTTINLARCRSNGIDAAALVSRIGAGFSFDRLIWGSDVAQSPQPYGEMTAMARDAVRRLEPQPRAAILMETADRLFAR